MLVSCIMPTQDRPQWVRRAIQLFLSQTWIGKELLIGDDGREPLSEEIPRIDPRIHWWYFPKKVTIGEKLNFLCGQARGQYILRWDDDDWYHPHRIIRQIADLGNHPDIGLVGYHRFFYYLTNSRESFEYDYPGQGFYAHGGTQCFSRAFWQANPYPHKNVGEDTDFSNWAKLNSKIWSCSAKSMFVARFHGQNSSITEEVLRRRKCYKPVLLANLPPEFLADEVERK